MRNPVSRWLSPQLQLIVVFLVFSCALIGVNYWFGAKINANGEAVQLSGRQRLELYQVYRWLAELRAADPTDQAPAVAKLVESANAFDAMLAVFRDGGRFDFGRGQVFSIERSRFTPGSIDAINKLESGWRPLHTELLRLPATGNIPAARLDQITGRAREAEPQLTGAATQLIGAISYDTFGSTSVLRVMQGIGAVAAVVFFFFLIWLYSRQLQQVRAAKRQTDEILKTVPVGLFLLNRDYRLGDQYSAHLQQMLQRRDLSGADFLRILEPLVAPSTLQTVREFVELLFGDRVNESLVSSLNPLDQIEVTLPNEAGRMERRYLGFGFRRVLDEAGILLHVLVSVTDITDRVMLGEELDRAKGDGTQQAEQLLELLLGLMKLDSGILESRLTRWQGLLNEANNALRNADRTPGGLNEAVGLVFRPMHTLKGEAAALGLDFVSGRAGAVEQELAELRTRRDVTGNDFLPTTVRLEELFSQLDTVRSLAQRLRATPAAAEGAQREMVTDELQLLDSLSQRVARDLGKSVHLTRSGIGAEHLPQRLRQPVMDIGVQFLRNAIAHGVEMPERRSQAGKPVRSELHFALRNDENGDLVLELRDDGRGIDVDSIRARLVATGRATEAEAATMKAQALFGYLFQPGFTTAIGADEASGRGVGLDIVRDVAARHGGRVSLSTIPGRGTTFSVRFPQNAAVPA